MQRFIQLFRCPLCARDSGIVGVDTREIARHLAGSREFTDIDLRTDEPQRLLRIKDGLAPGRPCGHIVSWVLDGTVVRKSSDRDRERLWGYTINYDHPWHARNDPDNDVSIALWCETDDNRLLHGRRLRNRWWRFYGDRTWPLEEPGLMLETSGTIYVAVEPEALLEELRATWHEMGVVGVAG